MVLSVFAIWNEQLKEPSVRVGSLSLCMCIISQWHIFKKKMKAVDILTFYSQLLIKRVEIQSSSPIVDIIVGKCHSKELFEDVLTKQNVRTFFFFFFKLQQILTQDTFSGVKRVILMSAHSWGHGRLMLFFCLWSVSCLCWQIWVTEIGHV